MNFSAETSEIVGRVKLVKDEAVRLYYNKYLFKDGKEVIIMDLNIDRIAQETFELVERKSFRSHSNLSFDENLVEQKDQLDDKGESDSQFIDRLFDLATYDQLDCLNTETSNGRIDIPKAPGLLYFYDGGDSTFSLRGMACSNLFEHHRKILQDESLRSNVFKMDSQKPEDINFFETPNIESAQVIADELFKRRFPRDEEVLCNIADPGFSWWLERQGDGFTIYFKSHGLERNQRYTCLGPMGDTSLALEMFKQLQDIPLLNECNFRLTPRSFHVQTENHFVLELFENVFIEGDIQFERSLFSNRKSLYFYFRELALLRSFWRNISML